MISLKTDFSKDIGKIKPVHGIGNGPLTNHFLFDATDHFKEAGFPYSRLHDAEYPYGSGEFVDISCIFKNFDLPVNDPNSYNFTFTDEYLKAINNTGAKIIYRLGQTIEHAPIKLHIFPPKDYQKWAEICEHIIRHYNEGWANGYKMNIEYWEIWNEPDISTCWAGEWREYSNLYKIVAPYLKKCFPKIKIGGPTISSMNSQKFLEYFFTTITKDERMPLDFFSWHDYTKNPKQSSASARVADKLLKKYGYNNAESVYDEWNYVDDWGNITESHDVISSLKGAAHCAGTLIELQNSPCDIAAYYDGQVNAHNTFCGLFEPGKPKNHGDKIKVMKKKPFYSFKAFNELYKLGTQVEVTGQRDELYALAASNGKNGAIMMSNFSESEVEVAVDFSGIKCNIIGFYILNNDYDLESVELGENLKLEKYAVALLEVKLQNND